MATGPWAMRATRRGSSLRRTAGRRGGSRGVATAGQQGPVLIGDGNLGIRVERIRARARVGEHPRGVL
jgi:hypothetical protein